MVLLKKTRKIKKRNARKNKTITKTKTHLKYQKKYQGGGLFDNSFLTSYDENLSKIQSAIAKFSGKHTIDMTIADQFINDQLSEARKQAARDLIENTVYITLAEVSSIIETLIIKLYTENNLNSAKKIYFYSGKPDKSFYFISVLALSYIRKHKFKEPTHFISELNNNLFDEIGIDPLIILDDVSYSGSQLSTMLNNIYYDRVIENKKTVPNIFVLLVALNNFSKIQLENVPINKTKRGTIQHYTTSPFKLLYLPDRLYTPLIIKLGLERYFNLNIFFSLYTEHTPYVSIYLDHKLADEASTYKNVLLYGPIVPSNYNYKDFIISNLDTIYDFIPSLISSSEKGTLIQKFNEANKTTYTSSDRVVTLVPFLLNKLEGSESIVRQMDVKTIQFRPFINSCNKSPELLEIISNEEIINSDYLLFIAPKGCIANNSNCILKNGAIKNYLEETLTESISKEKQIEISNKINSFICPISWYKTGEFQMKLVS